MICPCVFICMYFCRSVLCIHSGVHVHTCVSMPVHTTENAGVEREFALLKHFGWK